MSAWLITYIAVQFVAAWFVFIVGALNPGAMTARKPLLAQGGYALARVAGLLFVLYMSGVLKI